MPFYDPVNKDNIINPIYQTDPNLMKDYFKIQKGPFYLVPGGGFHTFDNIYPNFSRNNTFKYLNGTYVNPFLENGGAFTFQLTDGTVISFCMWKYWVYNILVDVNGPKGPNTYGRDIYWLQAPWRKDLGRQEIHPLGDKYTGGSNTALGLQYKTLSSTCQIGDNKSTDFSGKYSGTTCGYEIIKNRAFKIPKE